MRQLIEGVKFCGVMNEAEINRAAQAGASAVGVLIRPDSTYDERSPDSHSVSVETATRLARITPARLRFDAVMHTDVLEEIIDIVETVGPDRLQLGESEDPGLAAELRARYKLRAYPEIAQVIRVGEDTDPEVIDDYPTIRYFLLDSHGDQSGGNGIKNDWENSRKITERADAQGKFVTLAGGLNPDIVGEAVKAVNPHGLDVESGTRVNGNHNFELMKLLVQNAKKAAEVEV